MGEGKFRNKARGGGQRDRRRDSKSTFVGIKKAVHFQPVKNTAHKGGDRPKNVGHQHPSGQSFKPAGANVTVEASLKCLGITLDQLAHFSNKKKVQEEQSTRIVQRLPDPADILTNTSCQLCLNQAIHITQLNRKIKVLEDRQRFQKALPSPASPLSSPFPLYSPMNISEDNMESPVDVFLQHVLESVESRDGNKMRDIFRVDLDKLEPGLVPFFVSLNEELKSTYPKEEDGRLVGRCRKGLSPRANDAGVGALFTSFVARYLRFVRDFTPNRPHARAAEPSDLLTLAVIVLGDSTYGVVILPTVLSLSRYLVRIVTELDKNPSLIADSLQYTKESQTGASPSKNTLVEDAANTLREAFIKCLSGGVGQSGRNARPGAEDKRIGIYLTANCCLKLLFQCHKLRNAQTLFLSIDAQSPSLSFYSRAQRVTYLYYLGRYHFANSHFYRAQLVLQSAYGHCHREALKHRRLILIYLMAANICLGRLPSSKLLLRREASDIAKRFLPLCKIIVRGDLGAFHDYLDLSNETAQWFLQKRILLQLRNRCEILVWRSLIRMTFILVGYKGEDKKVPFLRFHYVQAAARWTLERSKTKNTGVQSLSGISQQQVFGTAQPAISSPFGSGFTSSSNVTPASSQRSDSDYTDPEFDGIPAAMAETGFDPETGLYPEVDDGHQNGGHQHEAAEEEAAEPWPTLFEVESIVLSLIQQGFLRGFITHANPRFAIPGAKAGGGPLVVGFPAIWEVIRGKEEDGAGGAEAVEVPGWVREVKSGGGAGGGFGGGAMGGRVVRLSGARPAGAGPG